MKKITGLAIIAFIFCLFSSKTIAQTDYTYTLIDNGSYVFTVAVTPTTTSSNFATSVQSYGFTVTVPDGVTISLTSSLGGGAGSTPFDGSSVGYPALDGYLITETLGAPISIDAPSTGAGTGFVSFMVNGTPTSGNLDILANDSALAISVAPLQSFLQADTTDDATVNYSNRINSPSGVSAPSSFNFATLGTTSNDLNKVAIYPNPVKNVLNIKGLDNVLNKVSIYNVNGQVVLTQTSNLETINTSALTTGIYFVNLESNNSTKTIKLVKE